MVAWDPIRQQEVWFRRYEGRPAGVLTTAGGLLFQGDGMTQEFVAYRADTGERLWAAPTQTGVAAGPISYAIDGEQYVAQVVGGGQRGGYYAPTYARLLVFKLGGTATLPPATPFVPPELNPPPATASPETVTAGAAVYNSACSMCHGQNAASRGMFPDLRYSATLHGAEAFNAIVRQGALSARGMISYADSLAETDTEAVRAYLIQQANAAKNAPPGPP
jgi:alcohol dehydrogenase (cytochrome c)/quinohemoprotein ethanol dehydrogenase